MSFELELMELRLDEGIHFLRTVDFHMCNVGQRISKVEIFVRRRIG